MRTMPEGHMRVVSTSKVESIRIIELRWIVVGCAQHQNDTLARTDVPDTDIEIDECHAVLAHERTIVAQEFLDRSVDQARLAHKPKPLVGVLDQGEHGIAQNGARRLVPRKEQQNQRCEKLLFRVAAGCRPEREEAACDVVRWMASTLGNEVAEIVLHLGDGATRRIEDFDAAGADLEVKRDIPEPTEQPRALLGGDTDHLSDHMDGERMRQLGHEIGAAVRLNTVEQSV